jgi:eukaryotic-like serine/threonine-protein kinase
VICAAGEARGGAWGADGTIVFSSHWHGPLHRVNASGGTSQELTTLDKKLSETTHRYPVFLPDGEHFLYLSATHLEDAKSERNAIYVASLKSKERTLLMRVRSNVLYSAGHLLFVRDNALYAQPFDVSSRTLSGEARKLADAVYYEGGFFRGIFAASDDGTVVFAPPGASLDATLQWRDREGNTTPIPSEPAQWRVLSIAPDGRNVAVEIGDPADLWIFDLARGTRRRLTTHALNEIAPVWSPDGRTLAFASDRNIVFDVHVRAADGSGTETLLIAGDADVKLPASWSPDGRFLLIERSPRLTEGGDDVLVLPMTGADRKPYPLLASEFSEGNPSFSPDGRWVAFVSNESGRPEVYVTRFDAPDARQQISTAGAARRPPKWRGDGKELIYRQLDGTVLSVTLQTNGTSLEASAPRPLFRILPLDDMDMTRDGQRFLVAARVSSEVPPLTVVTGWTAPKP